MNMKSANQLSAKRDNVIYLMPNASAYACFNALHVNLFNLRPVSPHRHSPPKTSPAHRTVGQALRMVRLTLARHFTVINGGRPKTSAPCAALLPSKFSDFGIFVIRQAIRAGFHARRTFISKAQTASSPFFLWMSLASWPSTSLMQYGRPEAFAARSPAPDLSLSAKQ